MRSIDYQLEWCKEEIEFLGSLLKRHLKLFRGSENAKDHRLSVPLPYVDLLEALDDEVKKLDLLNHQNLILVQ